VLSAFQNELSALSRFIEVLQQEQSALTKADLNQLITVSQEKNKLAEQLNQLGRDRIATLASLGVGGDTASVENWLKTQPADVKTAWITLLESAKAAQHLNQINGKLIETQLQHTQQALNALSSAANQSAVYGADGQTRGIQPASQRTLGKG